MSSAILVSYVTRPMHGRPSGIRVWDDGRVELKSGARTSTGLEPGWQRVTRLGPSQLKQLRAFIQQSGLFDLPSEIPAPRGMRDAAVCEWQAEADGRSAHVTVHGWSDENPAARPLRALVMQMDTLIGAAQDGQAV